MPQMLPVEPDTKRTLCLVFLGLLAVGLAFLRMSFITKHARIFTALLACTLILGTSFARTTESDLQSLRNKDPQTYLQKLLDAGENDKWLIELRTLDPARYEFEKQKKDEKDKNAHDAALKNREAAIKNTLAAVKNYDLKSRDDFKRGLDELSAFTVIAKEKLGETLSLEAAANLKILKAELSQLQKKAFPVFRKLYAKDADQLGWESNLDAFVSGKNNEVLTLVAGTFASNANIARIQEIVSGMTNKLRFKRINYKWFKQASEWQFFKLQTPSDDAPIEVLTE